MIMLKVLLLILVLNFSFSSESHFEMTAKGKIKNYKFEEVNVTEFSESRLLNMQEIFEFSGNQYSIKKGKGKFSLYKGNELVYSIGGGVWGDIYDADGNTIAKNMKSGKKWKDSSGDFLLEVDSSLNSNEANISITMSKNDPELGLLLVYHQLYCLRQNQIAVDSSFFSFFE